VFVAHYKPISDSTKKFHWMWYDVFKEKPLLHRFCFYVSGFILLPKLLKLIHMPLLEACSRIKVWLITSQSWFYWLAHHSSSSPSFPVSIVFSPTQLTLPPWWWRQLVIPKHWHQSTKIRGAKSYIIMSTPTTTSNSNLTQYSQF